MKHNGYFRLRNVALASLVLSFNLNSGFCSDTNFQHPDLAEGVVASGAAVTASISPSFASSLKRIAQHLGVKFAHLSGAMKAIPVASFGVVAINNASAKELAQETPTAAYGGISQNTAKAAK